MRMFRKPLTLTNCQYSIQVKRSKTGINGILFNVNGEIVIKYDISQNYKIQNGILDIKLEEEYSPKKYSIHQVGIDNVAESYMSTKILEKDTTSDVVIDGWNQYVDIIPLDKVVKFLIARDIYLLRLSKPQYAGSTPSWDVCISLAMYLRLCEKIENFEEKLPSSFQFIEVLKDLILEIKQRKKALSRSNVFFCNVSRLLKGFNFYAGTELKKGGPSAASFDLADVSSNFDIMMKSVLILLEKGKVIVPYVRLYSIDPKIIGFPIPEDAFDAIKRQKTKSDE